MRTLRRTLLPVLALLALAAPGPATAERAAVCKRACSAAIADCAATSGAAPARARRQCRKAMLRACKRRGTAACELAPVTTTTIVVTRPTTTVVSLPTTIVVPVTTTTARATTTTWPVTTTTIPAVYDFSGTWRFTGSPASNTCPISVGGLLETFTIGQRGTTVAVTVGSIPGLVLYGTVGPEGLEASGTFLDDGCETAVALVAYPDGTFTVTAGTGFTIDCGLSACTVVWTGAMTRI